MNYKVIITGPVGSGKTSAVNSLTSKNAMLTDATVSTTDQATHQQKKTTTVAMDYDVIQLNSEDVVHVYGTPGQDRFDFMWDILSIGSSGIIILLDMSRNYPLVDLKHYTSRFAELISSSRLVIGLTHTDVQKKFSIDVYKNGLQSIGIEADIIPIDAREKDDITLLFHTLLQIPQKNNISPSQKINKSEDQPSSQIISPKNSTTRTEKDKTTDFQFTDAVLQEISKVEHVTGISLTRSTGERLHSTTNDEKLDSFVAFLSGMTPEIEKILNKGKINRVMLCSPEENNLTVFVEPKESLALCSDRTKSIQVLSQQVEDILQWL